MKGISHFITGVAIATFFPEVVQAAAQGSLLPVLGGVGGILPDTLDFKFARYWERFDVEIKPDAQPDPNAIADELVKAMRQAYETGKDVNLVAHTIRMGPDLWREYSIRFVPDSDEVVVRIGPLVNTGQVPYAGTEPPEAEVRRKVGVPVCNTYSETYRVNIFSGPTFRFARHGDELRVHFLDWHHRWSHSVFLAALVGAVAWLVLTLVGVTSFTARWGGLLTGLGFLGHVLEDQLGHMGSNLFWPLTRQRIPGPGFIHASDAIPNFLVVWTSVALILFNLDRFSAKPLLPTVPYLAVAVGVPWLVLGGIYVWGKVKRHVVRLSRVLSRQLDAISESENVEVG